ncbi:hypothetical protein YPPY56_1804, partial [Yersinia pestis PY-56]
MLCSSVNVTIQSVVAGVVP